METPEGLNDMQASLNGATLQPTELHTSEGQPASNAATVEQTNSDDDLVSKIVRQVDFYFSDTNLPTDNFLLKEVRKTPEGWVPVRLIASFKRMKTLSKDLKVIVAALETSPQLVVSGHRVRRKLPLPMIDETEVLLRTVIVDNLPDQATIDSLTAKFSAVGQVKMVRICQPDSGPRSIAQSIPGADLAVSRQLHALVEFENQDEVAAAVKQLTDSNNWRSGLRVRPLLRRAFQAQQQQQFHTKAPGRQPQAQQPQQAPQAQQHQQAAKQEQSAHKVPQDSEGQAQDATMKKNGVAEQQACSDSDAQHDAGQSSGTHQSDTASVDDADQSHMQAATAQTHQTGIQANGRQGGSSRKGRKGKRAKKDYAAWAGATAETRAIASAQLKGNPDAADELPSRQPAHAGKQGQPSAPGSTQPRMPDGSRGFSMGRGQALAAPQPM